MSQCGKKLLEPGIIWMRMQIGVNSTKNKTKIHCRRGLNPVGCQGSWYFLVLQFRWPVAHLIQFVNLQIRKTICHRGSLSALRFVVAFRFWGGGGRMILGAITYYDAHYRMVVPRELCGKSSHISIIVILFMWFHFILFLWPSRQQ